MNFVLFSGMSKITCQEYVVCTQGSTIQRISIKISGNKITLNTMNVYCNANFSKYAIYGIHVSRNESMWVLALYPHKVRYCLFFI